MLNFVVFNSKSFESRAKVCLDSIKEFHPEAKIHNIIIDNPEKPGTYVEGLARKRLEYCRDLIDKIALFDKVILLGADCVLYTDISLYITNAFQIHSTVLIPHVIEPPKDNGKFYRTGHINADMIGFTTDSRQHLDWLLSQKLENNILGGTFYEQTHLSSLHLFFTFVGLFNHCRYNVAYFNLEERFPSHVTMFQFSGYEKGSGKVSKYSDVKISDLSPEWQKYFLDYDRKITE